MVNAPGHLRESCELIEEYLQCALNYKLSQICYMVVDGDRVPVYYNDKNSSPVLLKTENSSAVML